MKTNFEMNLCAVLAHTVVLEAAAAVSGVPAGTYRNDMGTSYSAPNPAETSAQVIQAQMEAMKGTGKFAKLGSLPDLIEQNSPRYTQIALKNQSDYINGVNGVPGMLQMYTDQIAPAMAQVQSATRAGDIRDVQTLGPQALAALRAFNPQATSLLDTLNNQASQQLGQNGALDPFTKTALGQDVRSGQAARGVGTGYGDAAAEAYYQDATRYQRRNDAQQFAGNMATRTSAAYGDPFMQILGRNGTGATMAAFGQGVNGSDNATSAVTNGFSMQNPMMSQVYGAQNQANQYKASASNDLMGGLMSGGFGLLGSGMSMTGNIYQGAGKSCWTAREIFGEANPQWRQFRCWMLTAAPAALRTWYLKHGQGWAERIRTISTPARWAIQRWMERRITQLQLEEAL